MSGYPAYDATACRPDAFLGRRVALPELEGFGARMAMENPLVSVEQMVAFAADTELMGSFYRKWLTPEHWGVWQARMLEAMFWRLQDLASPESVLPHAWGDRFHRPFDGGSVPTVIAVHLDSNTSSDFKRMSLSLLRPSEGSDAFLDWKREDEWPDVATAEQRQELDELEKQATSFSKPSGLDLLKNTLADHRRQALWKPLGAYAVMEALDAWDATRWGKRKFQVHTLAGVQGDLFQAFGNTFGPQAEANLHASLLDQHLPAAPAGPKPRL